MQNNRIAKLWIVIAGPIIAVPFSGSHVEAEETQPDKRSTITLRQGLVIAPVGKYGRRAVHTDAIEQRMVTGTWQPPSAGESVTLPDGSAETWSPLQANGDGWFEAEALHGGYLWISYEAPADAVVLLDAAGHRDVYVNGELRTGDRYGLGHVRLPVQLRRGHNGLLFQGSRGRLRVALQTPAQPVFLDTADATLPDLIAGEHADTYGAVLVVNATTAAVRGLELKAQDSLRSLRGTVGVAAIPPLSVHKAKFHLKGQVARAWREPVTVQLNLTSGEHGPPRSTTEVVLRARRPDQSHKRTFISKLDDSVQYYAVQPAQVGAAESAAEARALVLTLHGAGVEALGQADSYAPKPWAHIVAATNRRPFGFDWEDWGRFDALEVLGIAQAALKTDPHRVYLTGHSMGGHGTWNLGATFPDRFAALGPSAGWISFESYSGTQAYSEDQPMENMLRRAARGSDTLAVSRNFLHHNIYILHGAADDNVPVEQAREMKAHLSGFHGKFKYHEQPQAGHWWDDSAAPGVACVDWSPMFELFRAHSLPDPRSIRKIEFATVNPGVSASCHWLAIEAQEHPLEISRARVSYATGGRRFSVATENVARLALDLTEFPAASTVTVEIDGQTIAPVQRSSWHPTVHLYRREGKWNVLPVQPPAWLKGPVRYGPFKAVFQRQPLLVYGTAGSPAENSWALAKARYDAETFWYRGNGTFEVIPDSRFDPDSERERNVVLYGNSTTNRAWAMLLGRAPVQFERDEVRIGERLWKGAEYGGLFIYPRPGSGQALVGVVGGSGLAGMRLTERLPYFVSGVGYPDCIVMTPAVLSAGTAGIKAAGFFGTDWQIRTGEFAYGD